MQALQERIEPSPVMLTLVDIEHLYTDEDDKVIIDGIVEGVPTIINLS